MTIKLGWLRDLLIIPIIVGIIVAVFQFVLPELIENDLELSYLQEEEKLHFDKSTVGNAKLEINDIETSYLYSKSIRVWNSGEIPIKNLPIKYVFETSDPTFEIFVVTHNTKPKYEFGNISLTEKDLYSEKYVYELLNPGDEFTISFLTNGEAPQSIYTKAEGLNVKKVSPTQEEKAPLSIFTSVAISIITLLVFILELRIIKSDFAEQILKKLKE